MCQCAEGRLEMRVTTRELRPLWVGPASFAGLFLKRATRFSGMIYSNQFLNHFYIVNSLIYHSLAIIYLLDSWLIMWRNWITLLLFLLLILVVLTFPSIAHAGTTRASRGRQKEADTKAKTKPSTSAKKSSKGGDLPANFYDRLGVKKDATEQQIRKAYRKLAVKVSASFFLLEYSILTDSLYCFYSVPS
ncbi:hypothetical protein EON65_41905 [archaeon]|nr:MAG: hypothetical protein EON65_41905 [archaeon]